MAPAAVVVELRDVSLRFGKAVTLSHLDWQLRTNEHWGVLGDNGSGKTSFLSLVRGDLQPAPEAGQRLYHANGKPRMSPIGFRESTGLVSCDLLDRYRQSGWYVSHDAEKLPFSITHVAVPEEGRVILQRNR